MAKEELPEFRKDLVSGDWILIAGNLRTSKKKPFLFKEKKRKEKDDISKCPFENPQKSGNPFPLLWHPSPTAKAAQMEDFNSWFLQVIPNKYPLVYLNKTCPKDVKKGLNEKLPAVGYHEVIVTRDHNKTISEMTLDEIQLILEAYKERYRILAKDPCVKYILIFHNQGAAAGASLQHPHSQLIALPVIDPDVSRSLNGSLNFYKTHKKCIHCVMIENELKDGERIIEKNEHFIAVVPFAPRVSYEVRIYPLHHEPHFEDLDKKLFYSLASSLKNALSRLNIVLKKPDYNFFVHTAPVGGNAGHYHWHIEILPRGFQWAGLELGGGVEVVAVAPEEAAENLRKVEILK